MRIPKRSEFALVWTTSAFSTVGTRTLGVAYPLLALGQTQSPTAAGWTGFALAVPVLILYVPWGLLVDRISPRAVMLFAEFCRCLTVATVLVAMFFGGPSLAHLIIAALVEGALWGLCNLAETAMLPSLVQPVTMWRALAKSEGAAHFASLAGRPLGGYLFGAGSYIPFAMNTALFAVSWGLFFNLPRKFERRPASVSLLHDLSEGFRVLRRLEFLRSAVRLVTLTNLLVNTLIMIFIAGSAGMSSATIGLVLAVGGVGGGAGAVVAFFREPGRSILRVHAWIWLLALTVAMLGALLAAQGEAWPYFALAFFLTGFGGALSNVAIRVAEVTLISPGELARVVAVARLCSFGALSLAAPLGGALVTWYGVTGGSILLFAVMLIIMGVSWRHDGLTPPMPDIPRSFRHSYRAKQALRRAHRTMRTANERVRLAKLIVDTIEEVVAGGDADMTEAEPAVGRLAPAGSQITGQSLGVRFEVSGQRGCRCGDCASCELRSRPHPA